MEKKKKEKKKKEKKKNQKEILKTIKIAENCKSKCCKKFKKGEDNRCKRCPLFDLLKKVS
ncbi:hypothetical protein EKL97_00640 [Flavobacterium sp. LS1P28]|nr:hypothetical protein EKL97_00640 [Flavobacterium sp. LS1P28]